MCLILCLCRINGPEGENLPLVSEVRRGQPMAQTGNQEVVTLRTDCQVVLLALVL